MRGRREAAVRRSSPGVAAAAAAAAPGSEESALVPGCLHFSALAIRVSRGGERSRPCRPAKLSTW